MPDRLSENTESSKSYKSSWWRKKHKIQEKFMQYVQEGRLDKVNQLLNWERYGGLIANVNVPDAQSQATPLHAACVSDSLEVIQVLLDHKADPNAKTINQRTPLHFACSKNGENCEDIVWLLLSSGADPEIIDNHGKKPIHLTHSKEVK